MFPISMMSSFNSECVKKIAATLPGKLHCQNDVAKMRVC